MAVEGCVLPFDALIFTVLCDVSRICGMQQLHSALAVAYKQTPCCVVALCRPAVTPEQVLSFTPFPKPVALQVRLQLIWLSAEHVTEVTQAQLQPGRGTQRPGHVHRICAAAHVMAGHMCAYQATVAYGAAVILWVLRS
jgi:hypothetical protein